MIELNGIYKLKHIIGPVHNDTSDFKVIGFSEDKKVVGCIKLNGEDAGESFVFETKCLIDPEKPDDIYYGEIIRKKG
jgi:hypothetical protein